MSMPIKFVIGMDRLSRNFALVEVKISTDRYQDNGQRICMALAGELMPVLWHYRKRKFSI